MKNAYYFAQNLVFRPRLYPLTWTFLSVLKEAAELFCFYTSAVVDYCISEAEVATGIDILLSLTTVRGETLMNLFYRFLLR